MRLSINTVTATARDYSWDHENHDSYASHDAPTWREIAPEMNASDLDDYDLEWRQIVLDSAKVDGTYDANTTLDGEGDDLFDEAEDHYPRFDEARNQHRNDYTPMMNFYWPLDGRLRNEDTTAQAVANAGACVLVEVDNEYGIALTGGGMDLSDHLVRAYVNAGYMPPLELLTSSTWSWKLLTSDERATIAKRMSDHLAHQSELVARYALESSEV